ncbi:CDP-alcohol phosphatidyltransferase family protein [Halonatronum saccharophilum]|uniref:CDP-alcohol phosphatidyltransferase family protein n=1 Tax=Halonatronum saccharophilum TaxID=150060 RepID=UPI000488EAFA|nr:CDP-alcohol phosphatidyltransferase family protein [Halonatronum saccharophilum]
MLIAGIIFSILGLTDVFDGYIARKYNQFSKLGRLLDPLTDKLMMISVFIVLAIKEVIIVVPPKITKKIVDQVQNLEIDYIWVQPGSDFEGAREYCKKKGLKAIIDECIMVEMRR